MRKLICELGNVERLTSSGWVGNGGGLRVGGRAMTKTERKKFRRAEREREKDRAKGGEVGGEGSECGVDTILRLRERVDKRLIVLRKGVIPRCFV